VFRIALKDPSPVARQIAISGLWEDERSDLIDAFISMMETDDSTDVRAEAASALALYANLAAIDELDEQTAVRIHMALLDAARALGQPELVRRRALESVAIFGGEDELNELISEAYDSDDSAMRASALYAMGRSLDRRWLGTVLGEFESDDAELRYEAARASGELGHVDAVSGLSELVQDHDTEVRHAAIGALGKIGGPGAIRVLSAYAQDCPPADKELVDDALTEARMFEDGIRAGS
jgi:HEAT repeat protein